MSWSWASKRISRLNLDRPCFTTNLKDIFTHKKTILYLVFSQFILYWWLQLKAVINLILPQVGYKNSKRSIKPLYLLCKELKKKNMYTVEGDKPIQIKLIHHWKINVPISQHGKRWILWHMKANIYYDKVSSVSYATYRRIGPFVVSTPPIQQLLSSFLRQLSLLSFLEELLLQTTQVTTVFAK